VRHYLQFDDFSADEYAYLLERAAFIKRKFKTFERHHTAGRPHAGHDLREGLHPHPRKL